MSYDFAGGGYFTGTFDITYSLPITLAIFCKYADHTTGDVFLNFGNSNTTTNDSILLDSGSSSDEHRLASFNSVGGSNVALIAEASGTFDAAWFGIVGVVTSAILRDIFVNTLANTDDDVNSITVASALKYLSISSRLDFGLQQTPWNFAEIVIYNGVMSDADIISYLGGLKATNLVGAANIIAYYSLDTEDDSPNDESAGGAGPDLVKNGSAVFDADHPVITTSGGLPGFRGANRGIMRGVARGIG